MSENGNRWSDADLLEWALHPETADAETRAALVADPLARERLAELEAFALSCRRVLAPSLPGSVGTAGADFELEGLAARVLARTTREDLSWRGDLGLVGRYVRARMRASALLRVAAAVLAVHVVGLSVLAYQVLRPRVEPHIDTGIELPPPPAFWEAEEEPLEDLALPPVGEEPRVRSVPTGEVDEDGR